MTNKTKATILDVAKMAGVSKGTVDRVLHNRGDVSTKNELKVKQAMKELEYEPNIYASMLAKMKDITIACILPSYIEGDFWFSISRGISKISDEMHSQNVTLTTYYYDQYNLTSFRKACEDLMEDKPDGVIIPPMFKKETMLFVERLHDSNIPYVYIDTKVEDENYLAYFGMHMYKSGYLCAHLMTEKGFDYQKDEIVIFRIHRDPDGLSDPMINRRCGFLDYLTESFPHCTVHTVFINPEDPEGITMVMDQFFKDHPNVKHITTFSSRIHLISSYFLKHPVPGCTIIGYDSLDRNMADLKSGNISVLIALHIADLPKHAVNALVNYIIKKERPVRKDNYIHMDILTRLNIDDYH